MSLQLDKEKTRKKLSLMLEKIKTEADPQLLSEYRALFKKEVSFFRRSWTAAYLLMLLDQGQGGAGRFNRNRDKERGGRDFGERTSSDAGISGTEPPRRPLPEEESRRLFISIGRNRRVFPREILGLINAKTEISRDDIGAIRILDNYSFVQVRSSVADAIIEALNGKPFRGRLLTVNYARARKEDSNEDHNEDSLIADGAYGEDIIEAENAIDHGDDQGEEEGV
jgi:hypothetical protein